MRGWLLGAMLPAMLCAAGAPAAAQDAELRARVQVSESDMDALIARRPGLRGISDAIAADCARRLPGDAATPGFCRCASAVVFAMWSSGVDGSQLLSQMNAYAASPSPAALTDLMRFAGPDIYRSSCQKALGAK
jgi:hypothetical protein